MIYYVADCMESANAFKEKMRVHGVEPKDCIRVNGHKRDTWKGLPYNKLHRVAKASMTVDLMEFCSSHEVTVVQVTIPTNASMRAMK